MEDLEKFEIINTNRIKLRDLTFEGDKKTYVFIFDLKENFILERNFEFKDKSEVKFFYFIFADDGIKANFNIKNIIKARSNFNNNVFIFTKDNAKVYFKEQTIFYDNKSRADLCIKAFVNNNSFCECYDIIDIEESLKNCSAFLDLKSFLLHKKAKAVMIPSLNIKTNQVKAGHSASISFLDDESIFYLQSRGLSKQKSQEMFLKGMVDSVLQDLKNNELRNFLTNRYLDFINL